MKPYYLLLTLFALLCTSVIKAQYGPDVKTLDSATLKEGPVSMDVAFNGWIYQSFSTPSGFEVVMSKDNGNTFKRITNVYLAGNSYTTRLVVAGRDTNNLCVFVATAKYDTATNTSLIYVNQFEGRTGNFINNQIIDSYVNKTRDIDIATDYKFPSAASVNYGIGVLYARASAYDSLFLAVSTDSGQTYLAKKAVATTGAYFHKVSIAYAASETYSLGRFVMAWEVFNGSSDTIGNLYTSRSVTEIDGPVTAPVNLDSGFVTSAGQIRNPRISAMQTFSSNDDSLGIMTLIVAERVTYGAGHARIVTFKNANTAVGNTWLSTDIDLSDASNAMQPDVTYDPYYGNFLMTYYDQTHNRLPYLVHDFNLHPITPWHLVNNNYVNDSTRLLNALPTVRINPLLTKAAFGWTNTYATGPQAMFDAEYRIPAPVVIALTPDTAYENGAAFTLHVLGTGFSLASEITWNGVTVTTDYNSATDLSTAINTSQLSQAGIIPVAVITQAANGGGGTSNSAPFYIITATAVNDLGQANSMLIYPNPSANQLNISYAFAQAGNIDLNVYDINGRLVKQLGNQSITNQTGVYTADISALSAGIYTLVISTGNERITRKLSVTK